MRWHAYIRTNRPGQEGSREEQYEAIQAYARRWRGEELDDDRIFVDEAISGTTRIEDRPQGSRLVEALAAAYEAGAAVTLLVWSIDRLGRNPADVEDLLRFTGGTVVLCEVKPEPEDEEPMPESPELEALWHSFVLLSADEPARLRACDVDRVMTSAWSALDGGKFDRFRAWLAPRVGTDEARDEVEGWMPDRRS
jgi:hypothetical protein